MNILLTNDDGIFSDGLRVLAEVLGREHRVFVCAPHKERSGSGHRATYFLRDLTADRYSMSGAVEAWCTDGTPVDCVYAALNGLFNQKMDLLISGINRGWNISTNIHYSGTIGAAFEGLIRKVPSVAVSVADENPVSADYAEAAEFLLAWINRMEIREDLIYNINVPAGSRQVILGSRYAPAEIRELYVHRHEVSGDADRKVFRFLNEEADTEANLQGDVSLVKMGYIVITPLSLNWTDADMLRRMEEENR